ncbi:MAG: superoxide dismutase, partial [Verrucomicrobiia bacterium]
MAHALPPLPYAASALEPHIDARTMEIHHGKHHNAYVTNLNAAIESTADIAEKPIEDLIRDIPALPEGIRTAVRNNGGGHWNHTFFWNIMAPGKGGAPSGKLEAAIASTFGSYDDFKAKFEEAGVKRFGSGWAWLSVAADKSLFISSTPNQDNPLMVGLVDQLGSPILGVDVWEHAYYLNYQNRRPDS